MKAYYYSENEYFPLANLFAASGNPQESFVCIWNGMKQACNYFDFRLIKHFCRFVCYNVIFTGSQLKELYNLVDSLSYNEHWNRSILHSYMLNIGEIREILLNNSMGRQRVEFVIRTTINDTELQFSG